MASITRWLLLSVILSLLISAVFFSATARADDDDEDIPRGAPGSAGGAQEDPHVHMPEGGGAGDDEADYVEDEDHADGEPAEGSGGIAGIFARAFFPNHLGKEKFAAGEEVDVLIAFDNGAENPNYMVAFVAAHLTHAADTNYYVQNFSGILYERTAHSGETLTLKYKFQPHESLDPHDYGLVIQAIFQNDENQTYAATAYNSTSHTEYSNKLVNGSAC